MSPTTKSTPKRRGRTCPKCQGSGRFRSAQQCYTCRGKGYLTARDIGRNATYWAQRP
jgi:DnaJ-class molecular chaperone